MVSCAITFLTQVTPFPPKNFVCLAFHLNPLQDNLAAWPQKFVSSLPEIKKNSEELAIAILAGFVFNYLHLPVGWLLGPMVVGIVYAVAQGTSQPVPRAFMAIEQAIIAIATAVSFSFETLEMATTYF